MKRFVTSVLLVALVATACSGSDGPVAVDDPWARTSPMTATAGAVYMGLEADEADALVAASVDGSVAAGVEIHETVEGDMDGDDMDGGMMSMSPVDEIALPAGEQVLLEPGGYHIMLLDLAEPLETGSTFDLTLEFASGARETVEVEVRDN